VPLFTEQYELANGGDALKSEDGKITVSLAESNDSLLLGL